MIIRLFMLFMMVLPLVTKAENISKIDSCCNIDTVTILSVNDTLCYGDTNCLHLSEHDTCWQYIWLLNGTETNGTDSVFCPTQSGYYSCLIYSDCDSFTTASIHIIISHPTVSISCSLRKNGCTLTANPSGGYAPYTYHWSTGASTQQILAANGVTYYVTVTDRFGCKAYGSRSCGFCGAKIVNPGSVQHNTFAYPNPTQDKINIELEFENESKPIIEIMDITGRIVFRKEEAVTNYLFSTIDLKDLPNGLYLVHIFANETMYEQKIIMQK